MGRVKLNAPYSKGQGKGAVVDPKLTPILQVSMRT